MRIPTRLAIASLIFLATQAHPIELGLLDDFDAGPMACTTDGWSEAPQSPNPPVGLLGCGESSSCCLQNDSAGGFGPGSRQVTFNESQWTGDYIAAGVNKIQMRVANASGLETLNLRIGVSNGLSCYVSTNAVALPPGNPGPAGLQFVEFLLDQSTMSSVSGNLCAAPGQSLATVLSGVVQLRVLSSLNPQWNGDAIVSTVQIDAIQSKRDTDLDGINDDLDNCTQVANPLQEDTNNDGYGNICDADLDDNCIVNFSDLQTMKQAFFSTPASPAWNPDADLDSSGAVNFADLQILKQQIFGPPGPGLGSCGACQPPEPVGSNVDFAGLPMFFRGGLVLDWAADPSVNGFSDQTGGLYVARFEVNPGAFEWKIADAGWSIEYCTATTMIPDTPVNAPLFGCTFPANGTIEIPAGGCYEFEMQTDGAIPPASVDLQFSPFP